MATQTYCVQADIENITSVAGLLSRADDDEGGELGTAELVRITQAIEWGAVEINIRLTNRYALADLANNTTLKHYNAKLAVCWTFKRSGNLAPDQLENECDDLLKRLDAIGEGKGRLPEVTESYDFRPSVSNLQVQRTETQPVRVVTQNSTGDAPVDQVKRNQL